MRGCKSGRVAATRCSKSTGGNPPVPPALTEALYISFYLAAQEGHSEICRILIEKPAEKIVETRMEIPHFTWLQNMGVWKFAKF